MKENQICYFIDYGFNMNMYISFGVYECEKMYGGHVVSRLKAPEIRLINGIPFDDFKSETEFKKVPKDWTYNTEMFTVTEDLKKKEKILNATKNKDMKNSSDLQWLFDNGYLVKMQDVEPVIEAEYDHKTYRLVKKYPSWTQCYGNHNNRYPDKVFETWKDAETYMNQVKEKKHREGMEVSLLDAYETLDWALDKYEADHGGKDIETIRQKMLSIPRFWEYILRYYKGEILMCLRSEHKPGNHVEWEVLA